jgi:cytochrome P450
MGSLPAYKRNPVLFFNELQKEYGDIARMRLGPYVAHLVTHPDGIRHVIQLNDRNYCRGRFYEKFKLFFGRGLLTMDGDAWLDHRRVAQRAFLRSGVGASTPHVAAATNAMLARWEDVAIRGGTLRLVPEVMGLTLSSLSRTLFGVDVSDDRKPVTKAIDFGVKAMFNQGTIDELLPAWLPTARNRGVRQNRLVLNAMIDRIRAEHDSGRAAVDLVDLLEGASDPTTGAGWSEDEVRDELTTIFLAGQETTALALCWILCAIASYPEVREELEAEVDRVVNGGTIREEQIEQLRYTRMVIQETLRLYPPIWLYTRDALADDEVLGYHIPAGSSVLVSPFATHRRPDLWPDPERFDPERFDPDRPVRRERFAYFPFGGGPRQCIGLHLAQLELQVMVATITSRFRLEPLTNPFSVGESVLSLRPRGDVVVRLRPREASLAAPRSAAA